MKRLIAILLCLSQPSWAALSFVQGNRGGGSASSTSVALTFGSTTASGNLIVVMVGDQVVTNVSSIADSAGNTYVQAGSEFKPSGINNYFNTYYANSAIANAGTVTVNFTGASGYRSLAIYEISGQATSSVLNTTSTGEGTSTSLATGSITLSAASEIICTLMITGGPPPISGNGTLTAFAVTGDANQYYGDMYHIVSANEAATASSTSSAAWGIFAASFKVAAGAAATLPPQRLLQGVGK